MTRMGGFRRCRMMFDHLVVVASTVILISYASDILLSSSSLLKPPPFVCSAYSINPKKFFGGIRKILFPSSTTTTTTTSPNLPTKEDTDFLEFFNQRVEQETYDWVQSRVIRLNLCPFADKPLNKDKRLTIHTVRRDDPNYIAQEVLKVMLEVMDDITTNPQMKEGRTALVVTPDFSPTDFEPFLMMVQFLEVHVMNEYNLHGHIQIVPFHPKFQYDYIGDNTINAAAVNTATATTTTTNDDDHDDDTVLPIEVITNRSPYPMFHILLEDDVNRATSMQLQGDPGKVWRRNAILLQLIEKKLGRKNTLEYLIGNNYISTGSGMENNARSLLMKPKEITDILKQTKIEFDKQESQLNDDEKQKEKGGWIR